MTKIHAKEGDWEKVEVLDQVGLFSPYRIDRETIPAGWYVYDVRHDDECQGDPVQICKWVAVNHWGTLLVKKPFNLTPSAFNDNAYLDINPEEDWGYLDEDGDPFAEGENNAQSS